jgi:hypothetical protein
VCDYLIVTKPPLFHNRLLKPALGPLAKGCVNDLQVRCAQLKRTGVGILPAYGPRNGNR